MTQSINEISPAQTAGPAGTVSKSAQTSVPLHPLVSERWSPRAFDASHTVEKQDLHALMEAARWAPSGNNSQPWRYFFAVRGSPEFEAISTTGLTGFNRAWAPSASVLIVQVVRKFKDDGSPWPADKAFYDAGLSASQMVTQAMALGLHSHYMGGFVRDELAASLNIDDSLEIVVVIAVGKQAPATILEPGAAQERELVERTRLPLSEIVLGGL